MSRTSTTALSISSTRNENVNRDEVLHLPGKQNSWKKKFQGRIGSWTQRTATPKQDENATLFDKNETFVEKTNPQRRLQEVPECNNEARQMFTMDTESQVSLTAASLFSRRSFPSIFSVNTDATSVSNVSLSCGMTRHVDVDSSSVKPFKRLRNKTILYLAQDDVKPPQDVQQEWEKRDMDRLRTDLRDVVMDIYRKGVDRAARRPRSRNLIPPGSHEYDISFELRMSGRAPCASPRVSVGPTIWITCGSTWACKDVRTAMEGITWPMLPVEVHEGRVPMPSVADGNMALDKLDLTEGVFLGDDITVYLHVEDPSDAFTQTSPCGLLCCATVKEGDTFSHYFSRIGGLVTTANTLMSTHLGISTAHGFLDHPWWHEQIRKHLIGSTTDQESQQSEYNNDDDLASLYSRDSLYTDDESPRSSAYNFTAAQIPLFDNSLLQGYRDPAAVSSWKNVGQSGIISFLEASVPLGCHSQLPLHLHDDFANPTDHMAIPMDGDSGHHSSPLRNTYQLPTGSVDITNHLNNEDLTEGRVDLLCGGQSTLAGHLLAGSTCLTIGGRFFTLRKVQTAEPLARGTSGTWIARGSELCGMIIAVSPQEPYVYMMPADQLFSDMKASIPSMESIEVFTSNDKRLTSRTRLKIGRRSQPVHASKANSPVEGAVAKSAKRAKLSRGFEVFSKPSKQSRLFRNAAVNRLRHSMTEVTDLLSDLFDTSDVTEIIPEQSTRHRSNGAKASEQPSAPSIPIDVSIQNIRRAAWPRQKQHRAAWTLEPIPEIRAEYATRLYDDVPKPGSVLMRSTPYSLANPGFRHGPVCVEPQGAPRWEPSILDDIEGLEWTALEFATAIEELQRDREDEIDDIATWWHTWEFEGYGELIVEDEPESRPPSSASLSVVPEATYSETSSDDSSTSNFEWSSMSSYPASYSVEYDFPDTSEEPPRVFVEDTASKPDPKMAGEGGSAKPHSGSLMELFGGLKHKREVET